MKRPGQVSVFRDVEGGRVVAAFVALLLIALAVGALGCSAGSARSVQVASSPRANSVGFSADDAPPYAGEPSVEVNGGAPFFTESDLSRAPFEEYAPLDALGRCGVAFALVGPDTMPSEPRGSIGMIQPSGWHTVRYSWVDGEYLYNRCHLIGYQLTGQNDNERNLITGTRTLNVEGMLPYENRVGDYVRATGNHVLYRATPVFEGDDLIARGVLLEAQSVEDAGAGVRFCAWCYNVEPGVEIDYATGESSESSAPGEATASASTASQEAAEVTYILNTSSHRFHYPYCSSVDVMAEHNKAYFTGTREEAIEKGYKPCGRCNP